MKILLLEELRGGQSSLRRTLNQWGYLCESAQNAEQAQQLAASGRFGVIILNLDLPGLEEVVAGQLRQSHPHPVFLVAVGDQAGPSGTVDAYLQKPLSAEELRRVLQRAESFRKT